jgi:RPA family protein
VRKRKLNHTVRWRKSIDDPLQFTVYVVSFDPDDADFAEIIPRAMP